MKVSHIQCNTLPSQLEPGAIYFVKDTGEIVVTDENGVAKRYGGVEEDEFQRIIPITAVITTYSDANTRYNQLGTLSPQPHNTQYSEIRVHTSGNYGRVMFPFFKKYKINKLYYKNAGKMAHGINVTLAGAGFKDVRIFGLKDQITASTPGYRNAPLTNSVLLYEGELEKTTVNNLYRFGVIQVGSDELFWGIAIDVLSRWDGNTISAELTRFFATYK